MSNPRSLKTRINFIAFTSWALSILFALALSKATLASGFQIFEQSGAAMGDNNSGAAAEAADASTAFYNPAGLVRIQQQQLVTGVDLIDLSTEFHGTIQVSSLATLPAIPEVDNGDTLSPVPFFYYSVPFNHNFVAAVGVLAPFGLATNYGKGDFTAFAASKSKIEPIDFTVNFGVLITDHLSLGAGFDAMFVRAVVESVAGLDLSGVNPALRPTALNSASKSTASGWGYGYHVGILWQFNEHSRVGATFHSHLNVKFDGKSRLEGPLAVGVPFPPIFVPQQFATASNNNAKSDIDFPPYIVFGGYHEFNDKWAVLASVTYTKWDYIKTIILKNVQGVVAAAPPLPLPLVPGQIDVELPQNFKNTWLYAIGLHYSPRKNFMFKFGFGYDQTPTNTRDRSLRLPDYSRYIGAFGIQFKPYEHLAIDAGWKHLFAGSTPICITQQSGSTFITSQGHNNNYANIYGLQFTWDVT